MAHDPEIWRKVLYHFRVWSAKNAIRHQVGEGLSLIAINEDEPSQSRPQGKPIAFLPCYHLNVCTAYEIYADVRGSRKAFNWFMGLAQWSGAHLSLEFLEQTPIEQNAWARTSPENLWLGLMFFVNWAAAVEARRGGFDRDPLVVWYPFQDAAHTIERCRLHTDEPAFVPVADGRTKPAVNGRNGKKTPPPTTLQRQAVFDFLNRNPGADRDSIAKHVREVDEVRISNAVAGALKREWQKKRSAPSAPSAADR